jgi:hypothetical protein
MRGTLGVNVGDGVCVGVAAGLQATSKLRQTTISAVVMYLIEDASVLTRIRKISKYNVNS